MLHVFTTVKLGSDLPTRLRYER